MAHKPTMACICMHELVDTSPPPGLRHPKHRRASLRRADSIAIKRSCVPQPWSSPWCNKAQTLLPASIDYAMATQHDCASPHATRAFAPTTGVEFNDTPHVVSPPTDDLPQGNFSTEAQAHWLDGSLAISAFFMARQYPDRLWQLSGFPHLSTRELVDRVLDRKGLRRSIALQLGVSVVTHCVPAVANILHREGHPCLCRLSSTNTSADVVDWLSQQVDLAVPEYQWHAGATHYARVNYLMVLVEEVFQTLPVSWNEVIAQFKSEDTVGNALGCISQAVRSAKLEPQVILGAWAAKNMTSDLQSPNQQGALWERSADREDESNPQAPEAHEKEDSRIPSPPDSQSAMCEGW
jgi:hypothetical protein